MFFTFFFFTPSTSFLLFTLSGTFFKSYFFTPSTFFLLFTLSGTFRTN